MTDPYKELGVSPNATDDEITQAYRKLAKRYHPDLHPGDKDAEDKMKNLNAAYDEIKRIRQGGGTSQPGNNGYGGHGGWQSGQGNPFGGFDEFFRRSQQQSQQQSSSGSPQMRAAQSYVIHQQYTQALHVLSEIRDRNAEWYYLSAVANAGVGNRVTALNHAREAAALEPYNHAYQSLLQQLQQGGYTYRQTGSGYGFSMEQVGKTLMQLCLMQAACMFCCRPC